MLCPGLEHLQSGLFRGLNAVLEPLVRSGVGATGPWPTGLVVVETRGRTTGRAVRVPLLGTRVGDLVVVSTVRGRAHWDPGRAEEDLEYSGPLLSRNATRSCGPMPLAARTWATRLDHSPISP